MSSPDPLVTPADLDALYVAVQDGTEQQAVDGIVRREVAKALRAAAEEWTGGEWRKVAFNHARDDLPPSARYAKWLRERADAYEAGEGKG